MTITNITSVPETNDNVARLGLYPLVGLASDLTVGATVAYVNGKGETKTFTVAAVGFPFTLNGQDYVMAYEQGDLLKVTNAVQRPDDITAIFAAPVKTNGRKTA